MADSHIKTLPNFPSKIRDYYECKLLHKKFPVWNGEYEEFNGKSYRKLIWICKECQNDNDTTPHKEAAKPTQTPDGLHK